MNAPTEINSSISRTVKDSNKVFVVENIFGNGRIETVVTAENNSFKRNTTAVWQNNGFLKHQSCDFGVETENITENSLIYFKQDYQSYKDNKKVYYGDFLY